MSDELDSAQVGADDEVLEAPPEGFNGGRELRQNFKCGQCGAMLEYAPGTHSQRCAYCGFENPIPQSEDDIEELDFEQYLSQVLGEQETEERLAVRCTNCGAATTLDPNVVSRDCPFCGSPLVASAASQRLLKPRGVLPFRVTREEARTSFHRWLAGLWFAPNSLRADQQTHDRLAGMYVPYWTYDSDTTTAYHGMRGEYYYVTEHYTTRVNGKTEHRTRTVRRTRWWPAGGTVWHFFDDVLVLASRALPPKYTQRLEPWDLERLEPYQDHYLSGFRAQSYEVDLPEGFERAKVLMEPVIRQLIRRDIGGDEQRILSMRTRHERVSFKHVLLPIWISAYRYQDKVYRFLVNGRTGEVQGERPWSWVKITLAALGAAAALGALYWFVQVYYK